MFEKILEFLGIVSCLLVCVNNSEKSMPTTNNRLLSCFQSEKSQIEFFNYQQQFKQFMVQPQSNSIAVPIIFTIFTISILSTTTQTIKRINRNQTRLLSPTITQSIKLTVVPCYAVNRPSANQLLTLHQTRSTHPAPNHTTQNRTNILTPTRPPPTLTDPVSFLSTIHVTVTVRVAFGVVFVKFIYLSFFVQL